MTKDALERHQVWIYLTALLLGLLFGRLAPDAAPVLELLVWPSLGLLLYTTFTQVPLLHLSDALRDRRFIAAVVAANFLLVPLLVLALLPLAPDQPALRLGMLLVLLVPCTDWFITFTHLGQGDVRRAIAVTPLNLLLQFLLLPLYLWLFLEETTLDLFAPQRLLWVGLLFLAAPLLLAFLTQRWSKRKQERKRLLSRLDALPLPLLAAVVFLVAGANEAGLAASGPLLLAYLLFLAGAAVIGLLVARLFRLPAVQGRTLIFSLGTRNSFVILPFALALPAPWNLATMAIVLQSLVELFGMAAFLWLVPNKLLPVKAGS